MDPKDAGADQAQAAAAPADASKKKAVIVAGGSTVPKADISIVVEARTYGKPDEETGAIPVKVKSGQYPAGADTYMRYDPETQFPATAPEVLTMGVDIHQGNFSGFTLREGHVNVGPAHPAYAAANLAYQRGATDIEIIGLTDAEKEKLQSYFDGLATHPAEPAQVTVSFS